MQIGTAFTEQRHKAALEPKVWITDQNELIRVTILCMKHSSLRCCITGSIIAAFLFLPMFFVTDNTQWGLLPFIFVWYFLGFEHVSSMSYWVGSQIASLIGVMGIQRTLSLAIIMTVYILVGGLIGWLYGVIMLQRTFKNERDSYGDPMR